MSTNVLHNTDPGWVEMLRQETGMMERLADLSKQARITTSHQELGELADILVEQARICDRIERSRVIRATKLQAMGQNPSDFLVVALSDTEPDEHADVVEAFGLYMEKAKIAQREVDLNRHYFDSALATVENTMDTIIQAVSGGAETYDSNGGTRATGKALCMSTQT
ncbi:MAG: hypothetical protein CMH54_00535 [Myxococcales bacterium]|nr:hypothetical protein [Myxococcales bacterium]